MRFSRPAGDVVASLCLVGTVCDTEGTFLWSWADGNVPPNARKDIGQVKRFGEQHDLDLLVTGEVEGGHAQAFGVAGGRRPYP